MLQVFAALYWIVAYATGGPHWRCLFYHALYDDVGHIQCDIRGYWSSDNFMFRCWHYLLILLCNPVILCHYAIGFDFLSCFGYSCCLLLYVFMCYFVGLLVVAECAGGRNHHM